MSISFKEKLIKKKTNRIRKVVMVCSGKGGVGKSTVSYAIAKAISESGKKVGLLDLDIHGPVEHLFFKEVKKNFSGSKEGLEPIFSDGMKVMSLGFLSKDEPIPIKGRYKEEILESLFSEVTWGDLDFLIVDMPPGISDELFFVSRNLNEKLVAVVVTTPSLLSLSVVKRMIKLLHQEKVKIVGIVENLSYFTCKCGEEVKPFGEGVEELEGEKVIGKLPIDPKLEEALVFTKKVENASIFWNSIKKVATEVIEKS
jgi:ATP-binding protein involved in chromosome partitioning